MITSKAQMVTLLLNNQLGNTAPAWLSVEGWLDFLIRQPHYNIWGVRSLTPGGPCVLNCQTAAVTAAMDVIRNGGHKPYISLMIDGLVDVTAWLEVYESKNGLVVEGIEHPDTAGGMNWRNSMNTSIRKTWAGTAAKMVLARHLNANSLDDLRLLLDTYPEHVIELSALDRCFGTVPHRNAICWEVRLY